MRTNSCTMITKKGHQALMPGRLFLRLGSGGSAFPSTSNDTSAQNSFSHSENYSGPTTKKVKKVRGAQGQGTTKAQRKKRQSESGNTGGSTTVSTLYSKTNATHTVASSEANTGINVNMVSRDIRVIGRNDEYLYSSTVCDRTYTYTQQQIIQFTMLYKFKLKTTLSSGYITFKLRNRNTSFLDIFKE
jgi:hypothetical protein